MAKNICRMAFQRRKQVAANSRDRIIRDEISVIEITSASKHIKQQRRSSGGAKNIA